MRKKNVLLISPRISDMYKDIVSQLKNWGMNVDFIEDKPGRYNPDFVRSERHFLLDNIVGRKLYQEYLRKQWINLLSKSAYCKRYDYLLVIDGLNIHPYLFEELRKRNPNVWAANFLYDSTKSLYKFQANFHYFDRVSSFDKRDCKEFGLSFLPIYWCESDENRKMEYDLFCFGTYSASRYKLFMEIGLMANNLRLKVYNKLYFREIKNFQIYIWKKKIREILKMKVHIDPEHYNSNLITHNSISSAEYRHFVYNSKIIVDSVNFEQDGMTARFMWALGAGRKIVTTNTNIFNYDCYNSEQIFVINDLSNMHKNKELINFLQTDYTMSKQQKAKIMPWRLDNWLSYLLNL